MIHNQEVNNDLASRGIKFIMDTDGTQFVPWDELLPNDIVIIPAFGTTVEIEDLLRSKDIEVSKYNTTCPFVEKVWNRSEKLAEANYTTIIHGKPRHEETRATFSHSAKNGHSIVVRDLQEAQILGAFMHGERTASDILTLFDGRYTKGFRPAEHLQRVGVVNQTTMLATETQAIASYFREIMISKYGQDNLSDHFADTRDTLCYATNDNQDSTYELLNTGADLAIVVGGYNSSNTSHIVELCERKYQTYFINSASEILSKSEIRHYDYSAKTKHISTGYLPARNPVKIVLTSGASCPDTLVDEVILKLVGFFEGAKTVSAALADIGVEQ